MTGWKAGEKACVARLSRPATWAQKVRAGSRCLPMHIGCWGIQEGKPQLTRHRLKQRGLDVDLHWPQGGLPSRKAWCGAPSGQMGGRHSMQKEQPPAR